MKLLSKIKTFKPKFGNLNHIKICEMIAELNKIIIEVKYKESQSKTITPLRKRANDLEAEIVKLIEFSESKDRLIN
jgi:hypothetical protein